ncbi:MAG: hypothetical protein LC135_16785 [Phycisphaerae bacterium]|nr:hypothetical protein [Phycisphaerae bacterium]MCZ2401497.1 hypothetical protein [Phycisphaerae bacterium]NUQ48738.1 hypothetical protein [Phycisphaerae bacterium]
MALNLISLILVLLITFMQTVFGFFSGIINLGCTIVAALIAFGFFEPVAGLLAKSFHPAYAEPTALLLLFVLSLTGLRVAADNLIRGNVTLPAAVDWAGAGVLGFINAQICVGVMVICVLMLPIGGRVLMFSRYERQPDEKHPDRPDLAFFERRALWLRSDDFTVWLVNQLSAGSMSSQTSLASVYPSFTDWVFFTNNTVQWESTPAVYRDKKGDGTKDGLAVQNWWEQTEPVAARYRADVPTRDKPYPPFSTDKPVAPLPGNKFVVTRLELRPSAADRDGGILAHLFRPTMIRLVGDGPGGRPMQVTPIILANVEHRISGKPRIVEPDNNFRLSVDENVIDAYFETPQEFKPRFVEYRRHARAALRQAEPQYLAKAAPPLPPLLSPEERAQVQASGAFRFIDAIEHGRTGDVDNLPIKMSVASIRRAGGELSGRMFKSGRIVGEVARLEPQLGDEEVEKIKIPDGGYRLFQLQYYPKKALTLAGQVFNYVALNVNQYKCASESGETYPLAGYYAIVQRGDRRHIELYYTGVPPSEPSGFYGTLNFTSIQSAELQAEGTVLGLLFIVKGGEVITSVSNQNGQGVSGFRYPMLNQAQESR